MIKYALKCTDGHSFESWFQNSDAFERLQTAGHLSCAICGIGTVEKAVMAPRVNSKDQDAHPLSTPASPAEQALKALREKVERESEYVGTDFAHQARAMHDGEKELRSIHGEATPQQAKSLLDDGVPVVPLPFGPRKTN